MKIEWLALLKGFGHKRTELKLFGKTIPTKRMEPNPDPIEASLDNFGYLPDHSAELAERYTSDPDAAGNRRHICHFCRCPPLHVGLQKLAHQAQPHPAIVSHVPERRLAMLGSMQPCGAEMAPI